MTNRCLFTHGASGWTPTTDALAPWDTTVLPGGPVAALLASAMEAERPARARLAQLDVLLLAPAPATTLLPATTVLHRRRRLTIVEATIHDNTCPIARATAVYLNDEASHPDDNRAPGVSFPEGHSHLELEGIVPASHASALQIRPVVRPDPDRDGAWIHYPGTITDDDHPNPTLHAVLASDLATALLWADKASIGHINPTITVHLARAASGQHTALIPDTVTPAFGTCSLHDQSGPLGLVSITALPHPERHATT